MASTQPLVTVHESVVTVETLLSPAPVVSWVPTSQLLRVLVRFNSVLFHYAEILLRIPLVIVLQHPSHMLPPILKYVPCHCVRRRC